MSSTLGWGRDPTVRRRSLGYGENSDETEKNRKILSGQYIGNVIGGRSRMEGEGLEYWPLTQNFWGGSKQGSANREEKGTEVRGFGRRSAGIMIARNPGEITRKKRGRGGMF